jgi:hypothetical protein
MALRHASNPYSAHLWSREFLLTRQVLIPNAPWRNVESAIATDYEICGIQPVTNSVPTPNWREPQKHIERIPLRHRAEFRVSRKSRPCKHWAASTAEVSYDMQKLFERRLQRPVVELAAVAVYGWFPDGDPSGSGAVLGSVGFVIGCVVARQGAQRGNINSLKREPVTLSCVLALLVANMLGRIMSPLL